jgi:ABC-type Fe3+/spermidine/putrescine transport system ATPase subunit
MIECRGVTARAGEFTMRDVSFAVPAGGYAVLAGPTASGKTTLLETIAGARTPLAGRIVLDDVDVTTLPPERRRVGMAYQHGYLFPHLDVAANVAYGARDPSVARELLARFGALALAPRRVGALSGGERQIVALCRALATRPRILLLDEPFSAIDRDRRDAVRDVVAALQREWATTTLHVTHDESDVLPLEPLRLEMRDGRLT